MALNVGPDFKQRWLNVPDAVRQAFIDDLSRVCDVLKPETGLHSWIEQDQRAQAVSTQRIEQAYADLKAQLIEEARIRKQQALEKSLADKRAAQEAYEESLKKDEIRQFNEQTQALNVMRQSVDQEISSYTARYEKTPEQALDYAKGKFGIDDSQILSELESVRLRLELEAETLIEESVASYRSKLQAAAQEEIDYILKNSNFSDEVVSNST